MPDVLDATEVPSVRYVESCAGVKVAQYVVHVGPAGAEVHRGCPWEHELEAAKISSEAGTWAGLPAVESVGEARSTLKL
jgi:hypothetical protein